MTRIVLLALLLVTGGAIVNVAVAWGCAAYVQVEGRGNFGGRTDGHLAWVFYLREDFGSSQVSSKRVFSIRFNESVNKELIPTWSRVQSPPPKAAVKLIEPPLGYLYEDARGWPCLAMKHQFISGVIEIPKGRFVHSDYRPFHRTLDGIPLNRSNSPGFASALPLVPIWPGFAINSILYAGILWMVLALPFVLRRRRRIKRGLCPACAYPVGASPVCTECGYTLDKVKLKSRECMGLPPSATPLRKNIGNQRGSP